MTAEDACKGCERRCACPCGCRGHSHMRRCVTCGAVGHTDALIDRLTDLALSDVNPMLAADPAFTAEVRNALSRRLGVPATPVH